MKNQEIKSALSIKVNEIMDAYRENKQLFINGKEIDKVFIGTVNLAGMVLVKYLDSDEKILVDIYEIKYTKHSEKKCSDCKIKDECELFLAGCNDVCGCFA